MPRTQIKGPDIESTSLESKISNDIDFTKVETDRINLTSVNPADTATFFGTDDSGNSTLHMRIGNGSGDKIQIESWNGSAATSLMEVGQTTVTIKGDLVVSGTTTTINSETLEVGDNYIILNSGVTGSPTLDAGIKVERGSESDAEFKWNETEDKWEVDNGLIVDGNIRAAVGSGLSDADGDTYVTVEKTSDEDIIRIYTGGSERVTIGNSDNQMFRILSLRPESLVIGEAYTSGAKQLLIGYDGTNNYASIQALEQGVAWRNLILQPQGGNIGIGTTDPLHILHIKDPTDNQTILEIETSSSTGTARIHFRYGSTYHNYRYNFGNDRYEWWHSSTNIAYLDANGNMWIKGKLTQAGCPANIKQVWKELLVKETEKPIPEHDENGIVIVPEDVQKDEVKLKEFQDKYYHNTGEMVMALAHGMLEIENKINNLQEQINNLQEQIKGK